jgi:hypothetical protein
MAQELMTVPDAVRRLGYSRQDGDVFMLWYGRALQAVICGKAGKVRRARGWLLTERNFEQLREHLRKRWPELRETDVPTLVRSRGHGCSLLVTRSPPQPALWKTLEEVARQCRRLSRIEYQRGDGPEEQALAGLQRQGLVVKDTVSPATRKET